MSDKDLWIVSTKSTPIEGTAIDLDGSEFYYVECLIPANSTDDANQVIEHLLRDKKMALAEIIKSERYTPDAWQHLVQFHEIEQAASHAKATQEASFALFISSQAMEFDEDEESNNNDIEWT